MINDILSILNHLLSLIIYIRQMAGLNHSRQWYRIHCFIVHLRLFQYIQAPFIIILFEVIAICVVRSVLAFMGIVKYRHKRDECYKAPILDSSYFSGGPTYLEVWPLTKAFPNCSGKINNHWFRNGCWSLLKEWGYFKTNS